MPKLSVVVPVYGAEKYIERCCRSLFEQTLDDVEYVFVDDCTPDRSMDVLKNVLKEYPQRVHQVKILHNSKNLGVTLTRKKGIEATGGDYIIHCDPDDWVDVSAYEKLYNRAKENDLNIVSCGFFKVGYAGKLLHCKESVEDDVLRQLLLGQRQGSLWNCIVKSAIVKDKRIMYPPKGVAEDLVLVLQYFHYASRIGDIAEPLYFYYQNPASVSSFGGAEKLLGQAMQMATNFETIECFFDEAGLTPGYAKEKVARKFFDKRWMLPAIQSAKDCSHWTSLHPEINLSLYANPYLSVQDKITSLLVELRL